MPDAGPLTVGETRQFELTSSDGDIQMDTAGGLPADCSLILQGDIDVELSEGSVWIEATVEKLIRADDEIEYLVLDVLSVSVEPPQTGNPDSPNHEIDPDERTDTVGDSLDAIANDLVGEIQLEQRTKREDGSVVTDQYGERDRADSTPSSDRDREVRRRHNNSG